MISSFIEKNKNIVTIFLFLLSIFLIVFRYTETPKVWVDEGVFTEVAKNVSRSGTIGLQTAPNEFFSMRSMLLTTSYPVIFPVAVSLKFFGEGVAQARFPMLVYIFIFLLFSFLLIKKRYGFNLAVISFLFLLSFAPLYGNGRPVQGEVPGIALFVIGLFILYLCEKSQFRNIKKVFFASLFLGLSAATKPLFLVGITASLFLAFLVYRKRVENKKVFLFILLGYGLPIFGWVLIHFPSLSDLIKIVPTFLYFAGSHDSSVSTIHTGSTNFLRFFTESTPLLFAVLYTVVALFIGLRFKKEHLAGFHIIDLILITFISFNAAFYLFGTGWYRYFFPAHALLYLIFPIAVFFIRDLLALNWQKKLVNILLACLALFQFYFLVFSSDVSLTVRRIRNVEIYNTLSKIGQDKEVVFYNAPETIIFLQGNNYRQYFEMDTFLVVGDRNILTSTRPDYFLTDTSQSSNVSLRCYKETRLSQYYLLEKQEGCK